MLKKTLIFMTMITVISFVAMLLTLPFAVSGSLSRMNELSTYLEYDYAVFEETAIPNAKLTLNTGNIPVTTQIIYVEGDNVKLQANGFKLFDIQTEANHRGNDLEVKLSYKVYDKFLNVSSLVQKSHIVHYNLFVPYGTEVNVEGVGNHYYKKDPIEREYVQSFEKAIGVDLPYSHQQEYINPVAAFLSDALTRDELTVRLDRVNYDVQFSVKRNFSNIITEISGYEEDVTIAADKLQLKAEEITKQADGYLASLKGYILASADYYKECDTLNRNYADNPATPPTAQTATEKRLEQQKVKAEQELIKSRKNLDDALLTAAPQFSSLYELLGINIK